LFIAERYKFGNIRVAYGKHALSIKYVPYLFVILFKALFPLINIWRVAVEMRAETQADLRAKYLLKLAELREN
jgi:hypothetical protein